MAEEIKNIESRWRRSKNTTVNHYRKKLFRKARQFNFVSPLHDYFGEMIGNKRDVRIADLGAGLFSTTGSTWNGVNVELYPSDILADEFSAMLKENNVIPIIPVLKEDMLHLSYPNEYFDIVHCENALDHCPCPMDAIKEMWRVLKPGGWIYLAHFENVGELVGYMGFHLWNIEQSGNDAIIWSPGKKFILSEYYTQISVEKKEVTGKKPSEMVVIKIFKP